VRNARAVTITLAAVVLDAANLEDESQFWHRLLGGDVVKRERHHLVTVEGSPVIAVQLAPNHAPPQWPDGRPQQVHLDLAVDDIGAAHWQAMDAGARLLHQPDGTDDASPSGYRVYADPAGHPFCLCWGG
jgi:catechol 2,3-dioxygenase-like lactoylglutathione lyase family enzyme